MTAERFKRKLTAILSADVKGYSRLMGEDEEGTIRTLNAYLGVITGFIQRHQGRVVNTGGDSVLAEFPSVVDAVRCSVGIQEELRDRNKELPEVKRMMFRIGVNLGDVVEEGGNILGDGVNIAARLESLAEAGGICISGTVYEHIEKKLPFSYEYLGEQTVKNIENPVRVYRILMEPKMIAPQGTIEKKAKPRQWPDKPSIAVLPFDNLTGDSGQETFVDGVTENITTTLSKIPEIFVIARNSAFEYRGKPKDVKKVAEIFGVRHVLEGSVQKSGERIRITAQLIDATSGHHIWSEKYDREMRDLFALLDDVTRNIAIALQIKLTEGEQARIFHRDTENLEAWALATQAWNVIQRVTRGDNTRARELAEEAVKLDPRYGFAWSLLAYTYFNAAVMGWCESSEEYFKKAIELNQKALTLNKNLFCATAMLGSVHLWQRQYEQAIEVGRKSIELGPNIAINYGILAITLNYAGYFEEAISLGEQAVRLHPFCPYWYLAVLATSYRMAGRYEEAFLLNRQILTRAQKEGFNPLPAYIGLAEVYSEMGRTEEAHAQGLEILRIDPTFSLEKWSKTEPFRNAKHLEKRLTALCKAGLK